MLPLSARKSNSKSGRDSNGDDDDSSPSPNDSFVQRAKNDILSL